MLTKIDCFINKMANLICSYVTIQLIHSILTEKEAVVAVVYHLIVSIISSSAIPQKSSFYSWCSL